VSPTGSGKIDNVYMPRVTAEAVLIEASRMDRGHRWQAWQTCGVESHRPTILPQINADGSTPMLYCPSCWTLFTVHGDPVNHPHPSTDAL
jgi:hypothetical protein